MRVIKSAYERVVFAVLSDFASFIYSQERGRYLDFHLEIWYNAYVKSIKQRIKGVLYNYRLNTVKIRSNVRNLLYL